MEKGLQNIAEIRLLVHTKPRESGIGKKKPELFELSLGGGAAQQLAYAKQKLGQEIRASEVFRSGEMVDVKAVSTGKGYQGVVKRFGTKIRMRKATFKRRHGGAMSPRTPARVRPATIAQAGQMGFQTRTEYNKKIMKIGITKESDVNPKGGFLRYGLVKGDYLLLDGSVPGPKKRLIMIRKGMRVPGKARAEHIEIKKIFLDSQQGV
jgi:large subunit ribosomal protein L3